MIPRLVAASHIGRYSMWLRFDDGVEGEVDLESELTGEVFEPLTDEAYFKQGVFNQELRTVVWPNGADFAPEFLRAALKVVA